MRFCSLILEPMEGLRCRERLHITLANNRARRASYRDRGHDRARREARTRPPSSSRDCCFEEQTPHFVHRKATARSLGEGVKPTLKEACSRREVESAMCVQRFDDSLNSAIRITYRILLRSSSLREPRYPLLTVVSLFFTCVDFSCARDFSRLVIGMGFV